MYKKQYKIPMMAERSYKNDDDDISEQMFDRDLNNGDHYANHYNGSVVTDFFKRSSNVKCKYRLRKK